MTKENLRLEKDGHKFRVPSTYKESFSKFVSTAQALHYALYRRNSKLYMSDAMEWLEMEENRFHYLLLCSDIS